MYACVSDYCQFTRKYIYIFIRCINLCGDVSEHICGKCRWCVLGDLFYLNLFLVEKPRT